MKILLALLVLLLLIAGSGIRAETYYVDSNNGSDANSGSQTQPLQTIEKAAELVNASSEPEPTYIKIFPGIYYLASTILFQNERAYTEEERLIIESTILPDDPDWGPDKMPVIFSLTEFETGETELYVIGFALELNHVTIRGLKFLGYPSTQVRYYPVWRYGKTLDDLIVTQCLFMGDRHTLPLCLPIIANGHRLIVDHCIFYNCENSVVFWFAEEGLSKGNVMKYCIVDGAYTSGVWTCGTDEDFEFHHNIITRSEYFWMRSPQQNQKYKIFDCVVTDNKHFSGIGRSSGVIGESGPEIIFDEKNIIKEGTVILDTYNEHPVGLNELPRPRDYLHVMPEFLGSDLGAGLFIK